MNKKIRCLILFLFFSVILLFSSACAKEEELSVKFKDDEVTINLDETNEYEFLYTITNPSGCSISFECNLESGYKYNGTKVIFSDTGCYIFTIYVSNQEKTVSDSITINVVKDLVVEIDTDASIGSYFCIKFLNPVSLSRKISSAVESSMRAFSYARSLSLLSLSIS